MQWPSFRRLGAQDRSVVQEALEIAVLALSPIIPHVTHALWRGLGHWHRADRRALAGGRCAGVAVGHGANGRAGERQAARRTSRVAADADEAAVRAAALADPNVQKFIGDCGGTQGDHRAGQAREHRGVMLRGQLDSYARRLIGASARCPPAAFVWPAAIRCRRSWRGPICR